jgi:hypothetical protein
MPFQRGQFHAPTVDDGFARVAVFVDQPLGAPRQVVLECVARIARQRAHAHPQIEKFAAAAQEALREVVANHADETRREPTLGHQHGTRTPPQFANHPGGGHILGQVEVVHAKPRRHFCHVDGGMERQRIEHRIGAGQQRRAGAGLG